MKTKLSKVEGQAIHPWRTRTTIKTTLATTLIGTLLLGSEVLGPAAALSDGEPGGGTLRQLIADAAPGSTITLTNTGVVTLTNELVINKDLTIAGSGAGNLAISGSNNSRVFNIAGGVTVTIADLTIRDGRAPNGANGANYSAAGSSGASGGGILNAGELTVLACVITNNRAGNGGAGYVGAQGANGGYGGAGGSGGTGGFGGGVFNTSAGILSLHDSTIAGNSSGSGGWGGMGGRGNDSTGTGYRGGPGGAGGQGGIGAGVCSIGWVSINRCTFSANNNGGGGGGGRGGNGGNHTYVFFPTRWGGDGGIGGMGGGGGSGGGLYGGNQVAIDNSTLSGNLSGQGGQGGQGGNGGSGSTTGNRGYGGNGGSGGGGGGIYSASQLMVTSCTMVSNATGTGGIGGPVGGGTAGGAVPGTTGSVGRGGGVRSSGTPPSILNTILALNTGPTAVADDAFGDFASGGHNLVFSTGGGTGFGAADLVGIDPLLGPLADNGGPTLTHSPLPASPVIHAGDSAGAAGTDQRDMPRVMGAAIDIGAVEFQAPPVAVTLAATQIQSVGANSSALLNGTVAPNGVDTTAWFEWGTGLAYGHIVGLTNVGSGSVSLSLNSPATSLPAGQTCHYRLVASNSLGVVYGEGQQFTTLLLTLNGSDPLLHTMYDPYVDPGAVPSAAPKGIAAGYQHSLALKADGAIVGWGQGTNGTDSGQATIPAGATNAIAIAAGLAHSLALRADGTVIGWGLNSNGQTNVPAGLTNVVAVAGGERHSLALRADGTVIGWGSNSNGQTDSPPNATNVVAIAAGALHSLAIKADGTVLCWGDNSYGQTNLPNGLTNVVAIATGYHHCLALKADGTVVGWGRNDYGQTNGAVAGNNVVAIAARYMHSLALKADGTVFGWGFNWNGEATGVAYGAPGSVRVGGQVLTNAMAITAGGYHSLAIKANGTVVGWGAGGPGQTGNPHYGQTIIPAGLSTLNLPLSVSNNVITTTPGEYTFTYSITNQLGVAASVTRTVKVVDAPAATTLPISSVHSSGLLATATMNGMVNPNGMPTIAWFEWGTGTGYGHTAGTTNLGDGVLPQALSFVLLDLPVGVPCHYRMVASNFAGIRYGANHQFSPLLLAMEGMASMTNLCHSDFPDPGARASAALLSLAAGGSHSLALRADRRAVGWGNNADGQANSPATATNVAAIAAGGVHSLALRANGTVLSWGGNDYGQASVPAGATNVVAVAAGFLHSLALKTDGTIIAWGAGTNNPATDVRFGQALPPAGLSSLVAIAAGDFHSLAVRNDATVVGWGNNAYGQTDSPANATNVVAIAAGSLHSLALKADGTVVAWGNNTYSQTNCPAGATNIVAIAAGANHCLALRADGTLIAWGNNDSGQTNCPAVTNAVLIAAGGNHNLALLADGSAIAWGENTDGQTTLPGSLGLLDLDIARASNLNVHGPGTYQITYSITNQAGWTASVTRQVFVPFVGPIAGMVYDGTSGLPNIPVAAMREWEIYPTNVVPLPDLGTREFSMDVQGTNIIGALEVLVDITHSFRGDLELTLSHTFSGAYGTNQTTQVRLKDSSIDEDFPNLSTTYSTLSAAPEAQSLESLTAFFGEPMGGRWTLRIMDAHAGDTGTLNEWWLHLGVTNVITAGNGGFLFADLYTVPYYVVQPLWAGYGFAPPAINNVQVGSTNLVFYLTNAPISGRVFAGASGIQGVTVTAANGLGTWSVITDASGDFMVPSLAPGDYTVVPSLPGHLFSPASWSARARTAKVDFDVVGYPISGRVTNRLGFGVANIVVSNGTFAVTTDEDGNYFMAGVPPATWTMTPFSDRTVFAPGNQPVTVGPAATDINFGIESSPPAISAIASLVIPANTTSGPLRFTVSDGETPAGFLKVQAVSSNPGLVPNTPDNLTFEGAAGERVLIITPLSNQVGTASITLIVTDSAIVQNGPVLSTSSTFLLRVNAQPVAGVGTALAFNGANDAVNINANVLPSKGSFSIEAWLKAPLEATNGVRTLLSQGTGANAFALGLDSQGCLRLGTNWLTGVSLPLGAWHHLAIVRDSTNTSLYLDAALKTNLGYALPHPPQTADACIGARPGGAAEFWRGTVDELRVWHRTLGPDEVQQGTNRIVLGTEPGLAALWRFDERGRTNAMDTSLNGRHGALLGSPQWVRAGVIFDQYIILEENGFADLLPAFDADDDALSYRIINPGEKGEAILPLTGDNYVVITNVTGEVLTNSTTGAFTYMPKPDQNGGDRIYFTVHDDFEESGVAILTVTILPDTNAPSISLVPNQTTPEDMPLGPVAFAVNDLETHPNDLIVTAHSTNQVLVPDANIFVGGSGTNRSVTITPSTNQFGQTLIVLTVNDGLLTSSSSFLLTVSPVNDPPFIAASNVLMTRGATTNHSFVIADVDSAGFTVGAWCDDPSLLTLLGTNVVGAGGSISFQSTTSTSAVATVTLVVSDGAATGTNFFTVVINNPPALAYSESRWMLPGGPLDEPYSVIKGFANRPTWPIPFNVADIESPVQTLDLTFNPGASANYPVFGFAVQTNGQILVVGEFDQLCGTACKGIGRLNSDGSLDTGFNPVCNGRVYTMALQPDGKIVVGGWYTWMNGSRSYIARLNPNGTLDNGFNPGANTEVYALAVQPDGKIVVGGLFTALGGTNRSRIGRLNPDGTLDAGFNPGADNAVGALAVQPDGKILMAGNFSTVGGQTRVGIARLNPDGTLDTAFNAGPNNVVSALAVQPDGKILMGGGFSTVGGQPRNRIARLNPDGTLDTGFNPGANNSVQVFALQPDGRILVGGYFTTLGGVPRNCLGRLNADGSADLGFNPSADDLVRAIALQPDGRVLVGGNFTHISGGSRTRAARLLWRQDLPFSVTATAADPSLVADFSFNGDANERTLTITPASNRVGRTVVTLTLNDGYYTISTNFAYIVDQPPRYALTSLGTLGGNDSAAVALNDKGQVVGSSSTATNSAPHGFFWDPAVGVMRDIGFRGSYTWANAINNQSQVVAVYATAGGMYWYFWDPMTGSTIDPAGQWFWNDAHAINERGQVAWSGASGGGDTLLKIFEPSTNGSYLVDWARLGTNAYPHSINNQGQVVGAFVYNDMETAYAWTPGIKTNNLGTLGGSHKRPLSINNSSQIVGYAETTNGILRAFICQSPTNTMADLGWPGTATRGNAINENGQIVGYFTGPAGKRACLDSDGALLDLLGFVTTNAGWTSLEEASDINNFGQIVGVGWFGGQRRAFLLTPQWVIGEPVPVPTLAINPETDRPYRQPYFTPEAFVWSDVDAKLYPIRPGGAAVAWYDSTNEWTTVTNVTTVVAGTTVTYVTNLVDLPAAPQVSNSAVCVWPETAQIHVAGAPVQLDPPAGTSGFQFLNLEYTGNNAAVNLGTKTFTAFLPGYSVLRYLFVPPGFGQSLDPAAQTNIVQVVRTVVWDDENQLVDNQPAVVGQPVADPVSIPSASGKSGFVVNPNAYYDGNGPDAIYDRENQTGPIVPINALNRDSTEDDLVVAFYHSNYVTGVDWPEEPVRFKVSWPAVTDRIVIASGLGSGPLDPLLYRDMRIFNQPATNLPGFNPNEEHAFFAPPEEGAGTGQALFALRNDLNLKWGLSSNYVLLKYRPPENDQWQFKVFEVVGDYGTNSFCYPAEAGKEIRPLYPLSALPLCPEKNRIAAGRGYKDYNGRLYARASETPDNTNTIVSIQYFYPLQPDFYYNTNETAVNAGDCIAWLDQRRAGSLSPPNHAAGSNGWPILVNYVVSWPTNVPTLQLGETLLSPKRQLPGIMNMANAELVFDALNPEGTNALQSAVRMYDPLSPRVLWLTNYQYQLSSSIRRENVGGLEVFADLPYVLRARLTHDPMKRCITFKGLFDDSGVGEPLLLPNILSARERDRIKELSADSQFWLIIDDLYKLTRNPNKVHTGSPVTKKSDLVAANNLLIGFINKFTLFVNQGTAVNYLKTGSDEISVDELRRLEATNAVTSDGPGVQVVVRAAKPDAPSVFKSVEVALESFGDLPKALTAGLPLPAGGIRYLTVVENDNAALGLPVSLKLIALTNSLFKGDVKVIYPDNIFDEKLTLRHSLDFAGMPENAEFEWYYHPDLASFLPTALPDVNPAKQIIDLKGWRLFNAAAKQGVNDITLGDGEQTSLFTLADNWFVLRYRYTSGGVTNWSDWVGDPAAGATPRAILAEGWIKRVIKGINPFEARVKDFHNSPTATYSSMLIQAGQRYEGDIALNSDPENLNQVGLIETYETILRRGKNLSIDGVPAVNSETANNALLLAASRISDLYMLLGNEAFADAGDPLVMFTTDSGVYGSLAPSIFCFQNQLDSLLDEELALLRGRDDSAAGVGARPIYNRLFWNFTTSDGEVAYSQTYNITDQNRNGVIDEYDARILFPQGHGDAWGHYLTATKTYYSLLRHPLYTWVPRAESILVAGASVSVDFLDERKFANAAAAKACTGAQLVDLTYRSKYVEDPAGQWQGYKDGNANRGWGLTEWARRAGQAAYFDWLTANALLPAQDPNTNHTGIQKIDRTTVVELSEIQSQYYEIQSQMDKADIGLNPLGLAKGVVPFDIDPIQVDRFGTTHFEQVANRATKMLNNALMAWDEVNNLSSALRRNQDSTEAFTLRITEQERDYKNRMIEVFGYPYSGDIGPGKTYPSGYDGPDIYHYMYAQTTDIMDTVGPPTQTLKGYFKPFGVALTNFGFVFPDDLLDATSIPDSVDEILQVDYPMSAGDYALVAPPSWGQRKAPGEIQIALSELLQSQGRFRQALQNYDDLIRQIEDKAELIQARYNLRMDTIKVKTAQAITVGSAAAVILTAKAVQSKWSTVAKSAFRGGEIIAGAFPTVVGFANDVTSGGRTAARMQAFFLGKTCETVSGIAGAVSDFAEKVVIPGAEKLATRQIDIYGYTYEQKQRLLEFEQLIRKEAELRYELATLGEAVNQHVGLLQAAIAKGERLTDERLAFRKKAAASTQTARYRDMGFRIFRNDALQKYRAQFDLAARYVFLAAAAYDYEVNLLGSANGSGRQFLADIVRQRSLGQVHNGVPVVGVRGLADPLARMTANFDVLKGQMGFLTPEFETGRFSLRSERFRVRPASTNSFGTVINPESREAWFDALKNCMVPNLWDVPEFRRYCRPFAPESAGPQPGLVIRFPSTVTFGQNFFGWPLSGGDSAYDSSRFATKIRSVGVWFSDYDGTGLSLTPRVYLVPAGADVLRSPSASDFTTREWRVVDQAIPEPYPLGPSQFQDPAWIPINDTLSDSMITIRRFASFRAYHDSGFTPTQMATDSRLIGRSVWNTDWVLIIPGGTFLNNPDDGLARFIEAVSDIKLFYQTYSYSGN